MSIMYLLILIAGINLFLKGEIIGGIIAIILICIIMWLLLFAMMHRINDYLVIVRYKNEISQMISFKVFMKNLFRNNFNSKTGKMKRSYYEEILKCNDDIIEFLEKTKKEYVVVTHDVLIKRLRSMEIKGEIIIKDFHKIKKDNK